jgi:hypothetical protein
MGKILKVLSIDFDYFQKFPHNSAEIMRNCYPDGHDAPSSLSAVIWLNHYASYESAIRQVKIDKEHLDVLISILYKQDFNTLCMSVGSHVRIFDFITQQYSNGNYTGCHIYNIDTHHDLFNDNKNLDCGNWGTHIKKTIPNTEITWIANRVSEDMYGLKCQKKLREIIQFDFDCILNEQFDLIFLCRSDTWLPPHLDPYFAKINKILTKGFARCLYEKQVQKPRFKRGELEKVVKEYRKACSQSQAEHLSNLLKDKANEQEEDDYGKDN